MPMLYRRIALLFVLLPIIALTCSFAVVGQDDDLIDFVVEALARLNQQYSVQISSQSIILQEIEVQGISAEVTISQSSDGVMVFKDGLIDAMAVTSSQGMESHDLGAMFPAGEMVMDIIMADEQSFIRVSESSGSYAGNYPEGWLTAEDFGTATAVNFEQLLSSISTGGAIAITREFILSAEELDSETLNGINVRVVSVTVDVQALYDSDAIEALLGTMDFSSLGIDMETFLQDLLEGATMTMTFRIGEDDGLVYQLDSLMNVDADVELLGQSMTLVMTSTQTATYSNYNQPVTIIAPELED